MKNNEKSVGKKPVLDSVDYIRHFSCYSYHTLYFMPLTICTAVAGLDLTVCFRKLVKVVCAMKEDIYWTTNPIQLKINILCRQRMLRIDCICLGSVTSAEYQPLKGFWKSRFFGLKVLPVTTMGQKSNPFSA